MAGLPRGGAVYLHTPTSRAHHTQMKTRCRRVSSAGFDALNSWSSAHVSGWLPGFASRGRRMFPGVPAFWRGAYRARIDPTAVTAVSQASLAPPHPPIDM